VIVVAVAVIHIVKKGIFSLGLVFSPWQTAETSDSSIINIRRRYCRTHAIALMPTTVTAAIIRAPIVITGIVIGMKRQWTFGEVRNG
jgi:hypothetical protein